MESNMGSRGYDINIPIGENASFTVDGSCMDSPEAPIRLKDGQRLLIHKFDGYFSPYADIEKVRGKVCVVQYQKYGMRYFAVKEVLGYDEISDSLRLVYYNPAKTMVCVDAKAIEQLYIVDGVTIPNS